MPFVETTCAFDEHLDLHEHHRARHAHHFGDATLDKLAELHGADELGIQFDRGVALDAGRLTRAVIAMD